MATERKGPPTPARRLLELLEADPPDKAPDAPKLPSQGVTACGRFAYRIDDEGRFFAAPLRV